MASVCELTKCFDYSIDASADYINRPEVFDFLCKQAEFYKRFYSWEKKGAEWTQFLEGALHARRK